MKDIIISARKLSKCYHRGSEEIWALKGADFDIPRGEFIAVVGPSGSGKTTLLHLLGCLDSASKGKLNINGTEVTGLPERKLVEIRRSSIGFVFQQFFLLPTLNVSENVSLPVLFSHKKGNKSRIDKIIETVGLTSRAEHLPHQLSGGEMQRVAIGRALVNDPEIILADEPTGNLDSTTAEKIVGLFQALCAKGITLVIVTHNMDLANMAHGMITLKDGEIKQISPSLKV